MSSSGDRHLTATVVYNHLSTGNFIKDQLFLRQLRIARISPEELEGKLTAREPVFIVDLRHELDVQADPMMIRGAVHLAPVALEQNRAAIPRDREVVLYCS